MNPYQKVFKWSVLLILYLGLNTLCTWAGLKMGGPWWWGFGALHWAPAAILIVCGLLVLYDWCHNWLGTWGVTK